MLTFEISERFQCVFFPTKTNLSSRNESNCHLHSTSITAIYKSSLPTAMQTVFSSSEQRRPSRLPKELFLLFLPAFQTVVQKLCPRLHDLYSHHSWSLTRQMNLTATSLMRYNRRPLLSHSSLFTGPCQRYSVGLVFSKIPLSTF